MTLSEINVSAPGLRERIDAAFRAKDCQLFLQALEEDLLEGLVRTVLPHPGEDFAAAQNRWSSFLAGKRSILKAIKDVGKKVPVQTTTDQLPLEHAIDPQLVEARKRGFQPPKPTIK